MTAMFPRVPSGRVPRHLCPLRGDRARVLRLGSGAQSRHTRRALLAGIPPLVSVNTTAFRRRQAGHSGLTSSIPGVAGRGAFGVGSMNRSGARVLRADWGSGMYHGREVLSVRYRTNMGLHGPSSRELGCFRFVRETRVTSPAPTGDSESPPLAGPFSLRCGVCGRTVSLDLAAVAVFTRHDWPECCGQRLSLFAKEVRLGPGEAAAPDPMDRSFRAILFLPAFGGQSPLRVDRLAADYFFPWVWPGGTCQPRNW
jgi:hypothetical protein